MTRQGAEPPAVRLLPGHVLPPEVLARCDADWLHVPRGGYGAVLRIPCETLGTTPAGLVRIRAWKADGTEALRRVRPGSLVPRD